MSKVSGRDPSGQAGRATHRAVPSRPSGDHPSRVSFVERIARAMFDCYRGYNAETQEMLWQQARYGLMRQAELALAAMREPTDEMIDAAAATPGMKACSDTMIMHQARGYGFDADAFKTGSPLHQAWRAMIDAAQAIEAGTAGTTQIGPVEDESAVAESDAHNKDRS
jgi:hypothetical protein